MDKDSNSLNWFEIPATDITRAKSFYEKIFSVKMEDLGEMMGMKMVGFPSDMGNGKLPRRPGTKPDAQTIYGRCSGVPECQSGHSNSN